MFRIKKGDTRPRYIVPLVDNYKEVNEEPINLTTASKVYFIMQEKGKTHKDGEPVVKGECEIIGAKTEGIVQYTWVSGDTDAVGIYSAEFEIHWEDGGIESVPNEGFFEIEVTEDLG